MTTRLGDPFPIGDKMGFVFCLGTTREEERSEPIYIIDVRVPGDDIYRLIDTKRGDDGPTQEAVPPT